jgi:hypothetical protein
VTGLTYNFVDPSTGYRSGIDWPIDWSASQFVTKTLQIGAIGYFYQEVTDDQACAPILCPFKSRTIGIGPQVGVNFPAGEMEGYLNLKAYRDFDTRDRVSGWTAWVTLDLSPKMPEAPAAPHHMITK